MKHPHYTAFLERMGTVNDLLNASSVLVWDSRTMMPASGTDRGCAGGVEQRDGGFSGCQGA